MNHKPDPSQSTLTFIWAGKPWVDRYHDLQRLLHQNVEILKSVEGGNMVSEAIPILSSASRNYQPPKKLQSSNNEVRFIAIYQYFKWGLNRTKLSK